MSDRPDFTLPVSIEAITIESLPIDIVAQTLGTVAIDITAQTLGNIDINIAAQAADVDVNIAASAVTLNILGSVADLNISQLANGGFEEDFLAWVRYDPDSALSINTTDQHWGLKCVECIKVTTMPSLYQFLMPAIDTNELLAISYALKTDDATLNNKCYVSIVYTDGTYDLVLNTLAAADTWEIFTMSWDADKYLAYIAFSPVVLTAGKKLFIDSVNVTRRPARTIIGTVDVDIVAQTIGDISIDIAAQSVGNIDINIAASAISLNVKTTGTEKVAIDIAAQTVGNVDVNIAAQAANIDVDIKAQTVDLNIKTSGGVNLVIDKLTQTAYVEDRRTLSNNGETASWANVTGNNRDSKFFPRGCRGFINTIDIYCKDDGAAGGTISVYISPHPSMGYVATADATVTAGQSAAWKSATFNRMWNYDSLFIFIVGSTADMKWGYDSGTPFDWFDSSDAGATWTYGNGRLWARAVMKAMTVGDLPVSGTINTIEIPSVTSSSVSGETSVDPSATETLITINGAGEIRRISLYSASDDTEFKFYVNGTEVNTASLTAVDTFQGTFLNAHGYTPTTPKIQLLAHAAGGATRIAVTIKFEFSRQFQIKATNHNEAAQNAAAGVICNLIR